MTASFEQEPIDKIVEIETFNDWLRSWRAKFFSDSRVRRSTEKVPIQSEKGGSDSLFIYYHWTDIPISIQKIITLQYEAAILPDPNKNVLVEVDNREVSFRLVSSAIVEGGQIDSYGEAYVAGGVTLQFENNPFYMRIIGEDPGKGLWLVKRLDPQMKNLTADIKSKAMFGDEIVERTNRYTRDRTNLLSATSFGLRDTARLLSKATRRNTEIVQYTY